ncbi:MAG: ribulose phosphate epimerase [Chloroflexi bacterium]|nr:MAG: ribulose phosphate epimerase [Chloroflexota bacterium]
MGRWKDEAQCAVMLTFDVDAETLWLAGDMSNLNRPGMLSQGTYGARVAVPLILDLLRRHELKATFFTPGWTAENHPLIIEAVHRQGHEIGHHGWIHEHTTTLSRDGEEEVLQKGIRALKAITGVNPRGYRSPSWEFSTNTLDLLHAYGFTYSSNLMSHFIPWVHTESGIVELPVSWLLDDAPFFMFRAGSPRPISAAENVYQAWSEEFLGIYRYGGLFNLTMHPQFIGRPGRLLMLERLIAYIRSFPDVWFATGAEIADYWTSEGLEHRDHHPEVQRALSLDGE